MNSFYVLFAARFVGGEVPHLVRDPGHASLGCNRDGQDRVPAAGNREAGVMFSKFYRVVHQLG